MKAARRRALLDLGALAVGLGAVLAVWPQRLPAALDFILSRELGDWLVLPMARFFQTSGGRVTTAWAALILLVGSLGFPLAAVWLGRKELFSAARPPRRHLKEIAIFALGALALTFCARLGVSSAVDVVENAWFSPESLDLLEPLILLGVATGFAMLLWRAIAALWGRVFSRRRERLTIALVLAAVACDGAGRLFYDASKPSLAEAAGLADEPRRGRLVFVLQEEDGRPVVEKHELILGVPNQTQYSPQALAAVLRYVRRRTVFERAALRYLYGGYTLAMDAPGLRQALALGETRGDVLGRKLLLDNLAVAPPGPSMTAMLGELSDQNRLRVGSAGWARLASVAAHLGLDAQAEEFKKRAATGPGGVPPGLFDLPERGGAGALGRIDGRLRGPGAGRALVALYCRPTPDSDYSLGPGQLVADAAPGSDGRFRFSGLAEGDYFLALAVDSENEAPPRLSVSGNRGDLRLSARRRRVDVNLRLAPTR